MSTGFFYAVRDPEDCGGGEQPARKSQSSGGFFYAVRDPSVCEVTETCPYDQPELRPCVGYVPTKTNGDWLLSATYFDPIGGETLLFYDFRTSSEPIVLIESDGSQCTWQHNGTVLVTNEASEVIYDGSAVMTYTHYGAYVPSGPTIPVPIEAGSWDVTYNLGTPPPLIPSAVTYRSTSAPDCDGSNVNEAPLGTQFEYLGSEPRFVAKFVPSETQ